MPYNEDAARSETNSLDCTSLIDEPNMGVSPSSGADEAIELLRLETARAEDIRIDREDRALSSAVFHDSLVIRAGLIVIVVIALLGLAWIVSSSLGSSHLPASPSVQIADSSAAIPGSKGDRIQPLGNGVHESIGEASVDDTAKHFSPSTSTPAKPSLRANPPRSPIIGHSTGSRQRPSSIRVNGGEAKSEKPLTPVPETKPTTIQGWTVREVTNGLAALEGPNGTLRVRRGDTVPGLGRIDSIVLWGQRWIVATSQGLISTP